MSQHLCVTDVTVTVSISTLPKTFRNEACRSKVLRSPVEDQRTSVENKNVGNCSASSDEEGTDEIISIIESELVGPTQKVSRQGNSGTVDWMVGNIIQLPGESDGGRSDYVIQYRRVVNEEGNWCVVLKRLIVYSEDRLKAFWRENTEKIRREIVPLPCRCERMNEIVRELVAEAEQWRLLQIKH